VAVLTGDGDDEEAGLDNQTALKGHSSCCHSKVMTDIITTKACCFRIKLFIGLE
jgi:hypothetical protein